MVSFTKTEEETNHEASYGVMSIDLNDNTSNCSDSNVKKAVVYSNSLYLVP